MRPAIIMNIEMLRLLFDFGMMILIWIIQIIVYPAFLYYPLNKLIKWHNTYVKRIFFVVMPLMISQLIVIIIQLSQGFDIIIFLSLLFIIIAWLLTFLLFVPMHNKLSFGVSDYKIVYNLIHKNWLRTILWSLVFLFNCI